MSSRLLDSFLRMVELGKTHRAERCAGQGARRRRHLGAVQAPAVQARPSNPQRFRRGVHNSHERWRKPLKAAKISAD